MRSVAPNRITTWKAFASAIALTLSAGGCGPESHEDSAPDETGVEQMALSVTARRADDFIDSVGVNTHLGYTNRAYGAYSTIIKPRLQELGIRHVRDSAKTGANDTRDSLYYQRCRDLAAIGIRFNLITDMPTSRNSGTNYALLDDIYGWCDNAVVSFEGHNEPELDEGVSDWVPVIRTAQRTLFETVKGNATIKHLRVIGPSILKEAAANSLGDLSAYMDQGNLHNYYGGRNPESAGWGNNGFGSVTWQFKYVASPVSGTKPVTSTETGWHNALNTTDEHKPTPEKIVGRYMPRLMLWHFLKGMGRTYPYELIDELPNAELNQHEFNFGLLRNDGTPKPAFTALKNMLGLLKDPGASFTPGSLDYTLTASNMGDVRNVLLQKRDGTFYLALWLGKPSWDPNAKTEITVPGRAVTLTLPTTIKTATVYTLSDTGDMTSTKKTVAGSLALTLTDRVMFLAIKPGI
ncbi:hypothetical protein JQX13_39895 [Archangium violaceum]|uniref:hypothetical protein n=1 Tax=Archangium violaceum TaxID=83451 RepID=UPI00193BBF51|nr:hypothetical protein [Archangium violaceum]QRK06224.1 hypothetical protein JQX13_39895 [Archangium violaceum]